MSETAVYEIVPAGPKAFWFVVPFLVLMLLVLGTVGFLLARTAAGSNDARFTLSPEGLRLTGDLYGRFVPASQLRGAAARVVDLRHDPDLRPVRRRMGTALPGYLAGWFRLAGGRKALLYVTARDRVVYLPTTGDFDLLLTVTEPDRMVQHLGRVAPRP
ncbi:hypothetical protein FBQ97_14435 [Acidobacteria bacterium ACD]|nr:MAG: hypothetical protein EDX89_20470 [Acidobacteriota bacterium]MCE7959964.1 hypothetical protein [Acidobacteria bacterium ACB2]MDL1950994.1 hypothetical protein [Acidobacteria bacterium ACD]